MDGNTESQHEAETPAPLREATVGLAEGSDEALMRAYVAGDTAAFRALFEKYAPILLNLTRRHLPSDTEAQEVVQQTFFQLHLARGDFRLDAKLRPWIFTIAMNLVRQYYRKKTRRREMSLEVPEARSASTPAWAEQRLAREATVGEVRGALAELSPVQREVIELHWFQERPFAEVAQILGSTEGTVRVRAHRAYEKLRMNLSAEFVGRGKPA